MDIRTKLIFACIVTSLLSMFVLGLVFYDASARLVREMSTRQLDAIAEVRLEQIRAVTGGWRDEIALVENSPRLRGLVAQLPADSARAALEAVVEDIDRQADALTAVRLLDASGDLLVGSLPANAEASLLGSSDAGTRFYLSPDGRTLASFRRRLEQGDGTAVDLELEVDMDRLIDRVAGYRGLGESGEVLLVAELSPGQVTVINRQRLAGEEGSRTRSLGEVSTPVRQCVEGFEGILQGVTDRRQEQVWAAVRAMPELRGGIIVKIDAAEELSRVIGLRARLIDAALSLGAISILAGTLVGLWLSRPLRRLRDVVERIRGGDIELRADTSGEDEVSFLAESLNALMDETHEARK